MTVTSLRWVFHLTTEVQVKIAELCNLHGVTAERKRREFCILREIRPYVCLCHLASVHIFTMLNTMNVSKFIENIKYYHTSLDREPTTMSVYWVNTDIVMYRNYPTKWKQRYNYSNANIWCNFITRAYVFYDTIANFIVWPQKSSNVQVLKNFNTFRWTVTGNLQEKFQYF